MCTRRDAPWKEINRQDKSDPLSERHAKAALAPLEFMIQTASKHTPPWTKATGHPLTNTLLASTLQPLHIFLAGPVPAPVMVPPFMCPTHSHLILQSPAPSPSVAHTKGKKCCLSPSEHTSLSPFHLLMSQPQTPQNNVPCCRCLLFLLPPGALQPGQATSDHVSLPGSDHTTPHHTRPHHTAHPPPGPQPQRRDHAPRHPPLGILEQPTHPRGCR